MAISLLFLLNFVFFLVVLGFVRRYIRREVGRVEYARHLEHELQDLLLDVNRSGAEIAEVIEQRSNELQKLLAQQNAQQKLWERRVAELERLDAQLELQRRSLREFTGEAEKRVQGFESLLRTLEERLARLSESQEENRALELLNQTFSGKWQEASRELEDRIGSELDRRCEKLARAIDEMEPFFEQEKSRETKNGALQGGARLTQEQRTEIERYIELGLDARIISQKTGVPLNLVEILIGVRGN